MNRRNKKPITPSAGTTAAPPRTQRWQIVALVLVCFALGAAAVPAWRAYRLPDRIKASLPPLPSLADKPATLREMLLEAHTAAMAGHRDLAAVIELSRLYHANDFQPEALACWRLLRAEQPRVAQWCYYLADLYRAGSDYPRFEAMLHETVQRAPDYAPAWLQLAELEFKTGRMEAAEHSYHQRVALLPEDPYANLGLARIARQTGQREKAQTLIEKLVKDAPNFSPARNLYAEMLKSDGNEPAAAEQRRLARIAGRFREADDPWLNQLNDWCRDPKRLYLLSAIEYQTSRGDRGKSLLERAVQLAPDDPAGYELLGAIHLKLGEPARAREILEQGIKSARNSKPTPLHFVYLGQAYRELRQPAEALRAIDEGLVVADDAFELHDARGVALSELGRHEEALNAFQAALARHPNDAGANSNMAMALLALGRVDEAVTLLQRALSLNPTHPQSLTVLGQMELDAGRLNAAGDYLKPLYDAYPEMSDARRMFAIWNLRAGLAASANKDAALAERHYRQGLTAQPDHPDLNANLGVLLMVNARLEEARGPLEAFHRSRPADPQSSLFLGQVYARLGRIADARRILNEGAQLAERAGNTTTAKFCREILQQLPATGSK